jgi:flagellar motility protein MotE (MotC chaperone)
MKQLTLIKTILISKVVLVFLALSIHQGWIQLGDRHLFAKAAKEKSVQEKPASDKPEVNKPVEDELIDEKEVTETAKRKSFLSELFELPKLNAKKVQKAEIGKYLDMAERKDRQISERTTQLAKREEQLKSLEKSIEEKLGQLEDERKFIAKTLQEEKDLKGERLDKIVELYDKMDPKKAATAFEKLDKDLAVALFKKLKQKQVTTILETMNPEKSVELTEYFARVKSAKEYDLLKELNESLKKEFQDCKGMPVAVANSSTSTTKPEASQVVQQPAAAPAGEVKSENPNPSK